jgi:hypothetical protein
MTRKALLVGINDYAPLGAGGPDLNGCVNDVRDMAHTLFVLGVVPASPRNVRILTNGNATKTNILTGLNWLVHNVKSDDQLVFYYSGHGSQLPNIPDVDMEPDRRDETIVPHDYLTAGMIRDDELRNMFRIVPPGTNLEVILDCCHSGTGTRDLAPGDAPPITARYVDPPFEQLFFLETNGTLPTQRLAGPTLETRDLAPAALNHVLWAACKDGQVAGERAIDGQVRGIFSYWFCKVLRRAGLAAPRAVVDAQVSRSVKAMVHNQTPQLEGLPAAFRKPVFGETRALVSETVPAR